MVFTIITSFKEKLLKFLLYNFRATQLQERKPIFKGKITFYDFSNNFSCTLVDTVLVI